MELDGVFLAKNAKGKGRKVFLDDVFFFSLRTLRSQGARIFILIMQLK